MPVTRRSAVRNHHTKMPEITNDSKTNAQRTNIGVGAHKPETDAAVPNHAQVEHGT